jgi:peptide/nickel transport system permease protein
MALNPFIADIGNILPQLISGATIVAVVLGLPTAGPLLLSALQSQDMYLAGSFVLWLSVLTVFGVLLSDLALAALDPRIRLGAGTDR